MKMAQLKVTSQTAKLKAKSMNGFSLRWKAEWISIMKSAKVMSQSVPLLKILRPQCLFLKGRVQQRERKRASRR